MAWYEYFAWFALAFGGGGLGAVFWAFGLARHSRRLSLRLGDIEDRLLSMKGKAAAKERWKEQEWAEELTKNAVSVSPAKQRYDNDPRE